MQRQGGRRQQQPDKGFQHTPCLQPHRLLCTSLYKQPQQQAEPLSRHPRQRKLPHRRRIGWLYLLEEYEVCRLVRHHQPREVSPRISSHTGLRMDERP